MSNAQATCETMCIIGNCSHVISTCKEDLVCSVNIKKINRPLKTSSIEEAVCSRSLPSPFVGELSLPSGVSSLADFVNLRFLSAVFTAIYKFPAQIAILKLLILVMSLKLTSSNVGQNIDTTLKPVGSEIAMNRPGTLNS